MRFTLILAIMLLVGTANARIDAYPSFVSFSPVDIDRGFSQYRSVRVVNNSKEVVNISSFNNCSFDFRIYESCYGSLAPGASCYIDITYNPWREGWHNCNINIDSRQTRQYLRVNISGRAYKRRYP